MIRDAFVRMSNKKNLHVTPEEGCDQLGFDASDWLIGNNYLTKKKKKKNYVCACR
jgi:hypothetical protein